MYRVLFVCIGNACRSQMAEAFARAYGSDVLIARSAGLEPCQMVSPATATFMQEKGIDLDGAVPKGLDQTGTNFDLIVNMSGRALPRGIASPIVAWAVVDPICLAAAEHRAVRDEIERRVQQLVLEFRRRRDQRSAGRLA